jgi:hypothetical protein
MPSTDRHPEYTHDEMLAALRDVANNKEDYNPTIITMDVWSTWLTFMVLQRAAIELHDTKFGEDLMRAARHVQLLVTETIGDPRVAELAERAWEQEPETPGVSPGGIILPP